MWQVALTEEDMAYCLTLSQLCVLPGFPPCQWKEYSNSLTLDGMNIHL